MWGWGEAVRLHQVTAGTYENPGRNAGSHLGPTSSLPGPPTTFLHRYRRWGRGYRKNYMGLPSPGHPSWGGLVCLEHLLTQPLGETESESCCRGPGSSTELEWQTGVGVRARFWWTGTFLVAPRLVQGPLQTSRLSGRLLTRH